MPEHLRDYPLFSACGLNCGLCPRHYTVGSSRCPGCAGEGFAAKHPACGVLSCSLRRGLPHCGVCADFPCARYDGADETDSFITHLHQRRDLEKARTMGDATYRRELEEKRGILERLLTGYDDGQRKSVFCLAVNLLELPELRETMAVLEATTGPEQPLGDRAAEAVRLLRERAEARGVSLRLRKKEK